MLLYLLKSSLCLAIFLVFYKLLLERQSMHVFKRFYLLCALVMALSIPLFTFITYVEPLPIETSELALTVIDDNLPIITTEVETTKITNYWPTILWVTYGLGVLIFGIQFIRNLYRLVYKINHSAKQINTKTTNVLLKEDVTPHTFLRYIFFNKYKFESKEIPLEVFWHEETHALQKHSLDILFIELIQIILWFNPLIYFVKKSIKLNHEFLADQGVLNKGIQPNIYQQLLLEFSSNQQEHQFTNAINYSLIKKRFTIMKTQTSKHAFWFRSLILLPILAFTLYSFSNKVEIEKPFKDITINEKQKITLLINGENIYLNHQLVDLKEFANALNNITNKWSDNDFNYYYLDIKTEHISDNFIEKINEAYRKTNLSLQANRENDYIISIEKPYKPISPSFYDDVPSPNRPLEHINYMQKRNAAFEYNGNQITANKAILLIKEYPFLKVNTIMDDPRPPIVKILNSTQKEATPEQIKEYNVLAKKINKESSNKYPIIKVKDIERVKQIYSLMSDTQKNNSEKLPDFSAIPIHIPTPASLQDKATPEQIKEYNKLAKHYNNLPEDKLVIKLKDLTRIRELYDLMSASQKKNAEPLPNFPPPPPPPTRDSEIIAPKPLKGIPLPKLPENATSTQKKAYDEALEKYQKQGYGYDYKNHKGKTVTVVIDDIVPPPPPVIREVPLPLAPVKKSKDQIKKLQKEEIALAKALEKSVAHVSKEKQEKLLKQTAKIEEQQLAINQWVKEKYNQSKKDKKLNEKELEELHDELRERREAIEVEEKLLYDKSIKSRKERVEAVEQKRKLILEERAAYRKQQKATQQQLQDKRLETKKTFEDNRKIIEEKVLKQIKEQEEVRDQKRETIKKAQEQVIKDRKDKRKKAKQKDDQIEEVLVFEEETNKSIEQIIKEQKKDEEKETRLKKLQQFKHNQEIEEEIIKKINENNFQDSRLENINRKVTDDYIKRFPESVSKVKAGDELVDMYEIPVYDFVKVNNTIYIEMPTKKGNSYYDKQGNRTDFKDKIIEVQNISKEEFIKNL